MTEQPAFSHPFRIADLPTRKPTRFDLRPDTPALAAIASDLAIDAVRNLRFAGEISARGKKDWVLEALLQAEVEQPCVVTLAPVATQINEAVKRQFVADMPMPEADEVEMPADDTLDRLTDVIDIGQVMIEALALALPTYPRAAGAELGRAVFAEPGTEPLSDEAMRPFANLADILRKGSSKQ